MQKRSSIPPARYLVALLAALVAGCGGEDEPPGPIPVDSEPVARGAYVRPLGAAVEAAHAREDRAYRERLITRFTQVTPENAMKWAVIQPERGEFEFEEADAIMEFARRTGKRVRGHPLVWDYQLPEWVADEDWSADELRQAMRDHIAALAGRYRGRIAEWDVVNEPLADDGSWARNVWYRALGPRWVDYAFRVAHEVDPKAKLFLNELGAERRSPKSRALLRLARRLKRDGVPIDGIGFQFHLNGDYLPSPERMAALFRSARRIGLSVAITEMDVADTGERAQARTYGDAAGACAAAPNCTGLTVWGVTDRYSWLDPGARPLPFDEDGRAKPALRALLEPLSP